MTLDGLRAVMEFAPLGFLAGMAIAIYVVGMSLGIIWEVLHGRNPFRD